MFEDLKPHIIELRKRLFISLATVIVMFIVCFGFWQFFLDFMVAPLKEVLSANGRIITTHPAEAFFTAMKVSFFVAILLSLPVIFWQFWLFVAPGLYDNEKKYVIPFVLSASVMFFLGASFCYYVVMPIAFNFLLNFGADTFTAMPKISEFIGFFTKLLLAFGISFELPIITFFLALIGLIDDKTLTSFFRYAVVFIFIFAAIMTPPDVLSQFLLAAPLIVLYGISILIVKSVNPAKVEDGEENDEENSQNENEK